MTLIELLVVILILATVYAISAPLFGEGPGTLDVKAATRQLMAGLRKARSTAVAEGHEAILSLDVEARRFSITGDARSYALPKSVGLSLFTAQDELVNERIAGIRFLPDGSSTGGRITVAAGEIKQTLDVDWVTGNVVAR